MSNPTNDQTSPQDSHGDLEEYVTFKIAEQLFGIPVAHVQDILNVERVTRIPLAPPEIAGSLNLRGRVVTAMNIRCRLNLEVRNIKDCTNIVVEHQGELYSLMVDSVGEVLSLKADEFERNPATLEPQFRKYSLGIHRLNDELLVVLDVNRLLEFGTAQAA